VAGPCPNPILIKVRISIINFNNNENNIKARFLNSKKRRTSVGRRGVLFSFFAPHTTCGIRNFIRYADIAFVAITFFKTIAIYIRNCSHVGVVCVYDSCIYVYVCSGVFFAKVRKIYALIVVGVRTNFLRRSRSSQRATK